MKKITIIFLFLLNIVFAETYYRGLIFDDEAYQKIPKKAELLTRSITRNRLPIAVSLKKYAPEVGSQGKTGTCTAWATAYGARTILESIKHDRIDIPKINNNVFSVSYIYNQIRKFSGCKKGSAITDALEVMKNQGVPKQNSFKFDCNRPITKKDRVNAYPYKIKDYIGIFNQYDTNKVQKVKKSLYYKRPVVIGMRTPNSFDYAKKNWQPIQNDYHKRELIGHAMVVVGYDDNKYGGSFELMNSWGTYWGDNGFTWIKYNDFEYFVKYGFELIANPIPSEPIRLGGELEFIKLNNQTMNATYSYTHHLYKMNQPYSSGTEFKLYIKNYQQAYLYVFGIDSQEKISDIFPNKYTSAYLEHSNSSIALNKKDNFLRMDDTIGKEYYIFLYSKNELDINRIKYLFKEHKGSIQDRLRNILGDNLIDNKMVNFSKNNIRFNYTSSIGRSNNKNVVAVIIEFNHIRRR